MQAPSCTFTLFPIFIKFTSPLTTALNQMLQSSPITTSPTIVELGAKKQLFPNCGYLFSTGSITGIRNSLMFMVLCYQLLYTIKLKLRRTLVHLEFYSTFVS